MNPLLTLALLGLATGTVHAQGEVKRLAQFDLGFARCEARFDHMKGHRDEAYLALWRARFTPEQRAALERQRKSPAYRQASVEARKAMTPDSPAQDEKVRQQCQATWSELQRNRTPVAASQPAARPPKK